MSSYLHPGGEREWNVDRENISALSAIFFHKWLRATAENHGGNAVHSQLQHTVRAQSWTEVSLSAAPQMPPWPQAFNQTSLLSIMKSAVNHPHKQDKEGCQGTNELQRHRGNSCVPWLFPCQTWSARFVSAVRVFFSPNVCRCDAARDTQQIRASSAETGRDGGGGGGEGGRDDITSVLIPNEQAVLSGCSQSLKGRKELNICVDKTMSTKLLRWHHTDNDICSQSEGGFHTEVRVDQPWDSPEKKRTSILNPCSAAVILFWTHIFVCLFLFSSMA